MAKTTAAPAPAAPRVSELEAFGTTVEAPAAPTVQAETGTAPVPAPEEPAVTLEACRDWAAAGWGMAFAELEEAAPWLKYGDDVKAKAVEKTAPVLFKYRDKLPDWFLRFREEIELGMFLGGMIYGGVREYREAKAEAAARRKQPAPTATDATGPQPQTLDQSSAGPAG